MNDDDLPILVKSRLRSRGKWGGGIVYLRTLSLQGSASGSIYFLIYIKYTEIKIIIKKLN